MAGYDPLVGRFLNADNEVQDPASTQNYNRYSYCLNNPLRYVDINGESQDDFWYGEGDGGGSGGAVGGYGYAGGGAYDPRAWMRTAGINANHGSYSPGSGGGGLGAGSAGVGGNGSGENGVYYDYSSGSYRSTSTGIEIGFSTAYNVFSQYFDNELAWTAVNSYVGGYDDKTYQSTTFVQKAGSGRGPFLFGYGADITYSFPGKDGFTGVFGQIASYSTGVHTYSASGIAKGAEASAGIYLTLVVPFKSSFTMNDISGIGLSLSGNYDIFGVNLFTNESRSYYGVNIGIGVGIGFSYSKTNTTINQVDLEILKMQNDLYFRYAPH